MGYTFPNSQRGAGPATSKIRAAVPPAPGDSHYKRCDQCAERIPKIAKVCAKCRSFQGGWWYARLFALGLPWFTVIFYFIAGSISEHNKQVSERFASLKISYAVVSKSVISLSLYNETKYPVLFANATIYCTVGAFSAIRMDLEEAPLYKAGVSIGVLPPHGQSDAVFTLIGDVDKKKESFRGRNDVSCSIFVLGNHDGVDVQNITTMTQISSAQLFNEKPQVFRPGD